MGEVSIKVEVEPDMEVVQFVLPEVKVEVEDGSKEILDEIPTEPQGSFLKTLGLKNYCKIVGQILSVYQKNRYGCG